MATGLKLLLKLTPIPGTAVESCPLCEKPARAFTVEGLDGYIEACPEHEQRIAQDALADQETMTA